MKRNEKLAVRLPWKSFTPNPSRGHAVFEQLEVRLANLGAEYQRAMDTANDTGEVVFGAPKLEELLEVMGLAAHFFEGMRGLPLELRRRFQIVSAGALDDFSAHVSAIERSEPASAAMSSSDRQKAELQVRDANADCLVALLDRLRDASKTMDELNAEILEKFGHLAVNMLANPAEHKHIRRRALVAAVVGCEDLAGFMAELKPQ